MVWDCRYKSKNLTHIPQPGPCHLWYLYQHHLLATSIQLARQFLNYWKETVGTALHEFTFQLTELFSPRILRIFKSIQQINSKVHRSRVTLAEKDSAFLTKARAKTQFCFFFIFQWDIISSVPFYKYEFIYDINIKIPTKYI